MKERNYHKTKNFARTEKFILWIFLDEGNVDIMDFWD